MRRLERGLALIGIAIAVPACSSLGLALQTPGSATTGPLDSETVIAGLKEALRIGSGRAVDRAGVIDGYLANELIRIALPQELSSMARVLRRLGLDRQVDQLEVAMNRAAEEAVGEARDVLWDEIRAIGFSDAMAILRGGPSAATDYFEERTRVELEARFQTIVVVKMESVGLSRLYADLAERYNALPLTTRPAVDLDDYVTERTLDGLFSVLGEEEARIRADPVARTTELLRRVFRQTG